MEQLFFQDLVILWVICNAETTMTHRLTHAAVNHWLESRGVTPNYCLPMPFSRRQWAKTVRLLTSLGLLEHPSPRDGYRETDAAADLFRNVGTIWKEWPLAIPVVDGRLAFDRAIFAENYRREL